MCFKLFFGFNCFIIFLVGDEIKISSSPFSVFFVTTGVPAAASWGNPSPCALGHSTGRQDTYLHVDTREQAHYLGAGHSSTCVLVAVAHVNSDHYFCVATDSASPATGLWGPGEDDGPAASLVGIHGNNCI